MKLDPRLKPWLVNTGKLAAAAAGSAAVGVTLQEVVTSFFANSPYGLGLAFFLGLVAKSPIFSGKKAPVAVEETK